MASSAPPIPAWTRAAVVIAPLLAAGAAMAQPRPPGNAPAAPAALDPAYEAARAAFEALPEAERRAIQEALVWTGDHNGVTSGGFGKRTFDAIVAYQKRTKLAPSGVLDDAARAGLHAAAQKAKDAAKFALRTDPATGVQIGVPERILPKRSANPNGGSRWQSPDDKITLDTRAIPPGETDLGSLFERSVAVQSPGRQVTYKVLRPDFFVVAGETPTGKFYIRYASGPDGAIRGFTLGYDKGAKEFDRTVIAIANSFVPFGQAPALPAPATGATPAAPAPAQGRLATGLVVAPRRVLTQASAVEDCAAPRAGGAPARLMTLDGGSGLALLDAPGATGAPPLRIGSMPAPDGTLLVLAHGAIPGGAPSLVATPAQPSGPDRLAAPLQRGAAGAPVFERAGALAGLVGALPASPRLVAGIVPPMTHLIVPGSTVAAFLAQNGISVPAFDDGPTRTAGEIAAAFGAAILAIGCGG